ncbi:hypothetical protein BS47DRAFT_1363929 [Hydnum rufescens UP504]|uniref:Uncharacterized protein n=1 Tax=Hydnum rufescens UP504 TaxID=1448309 RepID=A0A9P6DV44_9AGAM|nr:hypothetical protein BS47DRAFT_1363929 [Hydnum rufescens UP504]
MRIENWLLLMEFPPIQDLAVDLVHTESWRSLWKYFFGCDVAKKIVVSSLSDLVSKNEGRLPDRSVLVSDCLGHTLVTMGDMEGDHPASDASHPMMRASQEEESPARSEPTVPSASTSGMDSSSRKRKKDSGTAHWSAEFIQDVDPLLPIPRVVQTESQDSTMYAILQFVPPVSAGPLANPLGSQDWQLGSFPGDQGDDDLTLAWACIACKNSPCLT